MILYIENEIIKVGINTLGAELECIIKDNINRLYSRSEEWQRQSPVLFPFIGRCRDKEYYYNNKRYDMLENHGFANKSEFTVLKHTNTLIELLLEYNSDTYKIYPFKFKFIVSYEINDNKIKCGWTVINTDDKEILFNVGGHPAFKFNNNDNLTYKDYKVEFDSETKYELYVVKNNELDKLQTFGNPFKKINMTELIRKHNTVIFKNLNNATLVSSNKKSIRIDTTAPYLAFWHHDIENPSFLCIEPWHGLPEEITYNKHLENKFEIIKLPCNKEFNEKYTIRID